MTASFDFAPLALRYAQDERSGYLHVFFALPFVLSVARHSRAKSKDAISKPA